MRSPLKSAAKVKTKAGRRRSSVVRRSFALPAKLVEQVAEAAPEYGGNLNAIVRAALEEYVKRRDDEAFAREMEEMAAEPWIRQVNAEILREFEALDGEALPPP